MKISLLMITIFAFVTTRIIGNTNIVASVLHKVNSTEKYRDFSDIRLVFGFSQKIYINYLNDGRRYNFEKFNLLVRCENSRYPSRIGEIERLYIFPRHFFPIPNCLKCIFDGMRNGFRRNEKWNALGGNFPVKGRR